MILKAKYATASNKSNTTIAAKLLLGIGLLLVVLAAVYYGSTLLKNRSSSIILCDAEKITGDTFITNGTTFKNGKTRSKDKAKSGKYACKVNKKSPYGMVYKWVNPETNKYYKASVWRNKGELVNTIGSLVVKSAKEGGKYLETKQAIITDKNWELLEIIFSISPKEKITELLVYVYNKDENTVYFDDLKIEPLSDYKPVSLNPATIDLQIDAKGMQQLEKKRQAALKEGVLISEDTDWVNGKITNGEEKMPIELRLKGDWLDHLKGKKQSYRVKVKNVHAWNRLKTFNLQAPQTRGFLSEWVFHKMLNQEDVLSTRYDFIEVSVNKKPLGVYAYEEHFEKQLPEYHLRREGPILRFTEDGFWLSRKRDFDQAGKIMVLGEGFKSADIAPFKESKTLASPNLSQQFEIAQNLMHAYKYGLKKTSEIFDLNLLAKYYAIVDINKAFHSTVWHNQRFYYNPVISKLEPIGFDGAGMPAPYPKRTFFGESIYNPNYNVDQFYKTLFSDKDFMTAYIKQLYEFSEKSYIDSFVVDINDDLNVRLQLLQKDYPKYQYNNQVLRDQANKIHAMLLPLNNISVQAKTENKNTNEQTLRVFSYHFLPIQLLGFGSNEQQITHPLPDTLAWLNAHVKIKVPQQISINAPANAQYIFYQLPGIDSLFHSRISPWASPTVQTPNLELFSDVKLVPNEVFSVNEEVVLFKKGKHQVKENILIPPNYRVYFEPGTHLDLINKAKFISLSPVFMEGNAAEPIRIFSSDKSGNGFTVLQAKETSSMNYVVFDNLNTLQYKGWNLTGAVTFYESNVNIKHCSFINNHCEDALNLIRLTFDIKHCLIKNTFADGFDADFCKGKISYSRFEDTGNDGMDFSGSVIAIVDGLIINAGDKGLSVGEQATVKVTNLSINGAVVGVASKDLSVLTISKIQLNNCTQGFTAYQKKPEYGGGQITVKNYTAKNVKRLHQIEQGSSLQLKDKLY